LGSFLGSIYSGYSSEKSGSFIEKPYETEPQTIEEKELPEKDTGLQIKGQLLDSADNEPIMFASISIVGHRIGTSSDMSGKFTLKVPDSLCKDTIHLKISVIGYESKFLHLSSKEANSFWELKLSRKILTVTMGIICTVESKPRFPFWHRVTSIFRRKKQSVEEL